MVDALFLLRAMDGIGEKPLLLTRDFLELGEKRTQRRGGRKLRRALLLAAVLTLLLAACGYLAVRAGMSHRDLNPDDDNRYYLNLEERDKTPAYHLDLNFGTCAMALHFETEETGHAHCFRLQEGAPIPSDWRFGGYTMTSFFKSFGADGSRPEAQQRPLAQCLREAGMTESEAKEWYFSGTFSWDGLPDRPAMRIELFDGPQLHDLDLIVGWPEGTATIIREETRGNLQLLEAQVDVRFSEEHREVIKYLFLFDTERQVLLVLAAADEVIDFAGLEAIAEGVEIRETGFSYACDRSGQNFSVLGLAYG